MINGTLVNAAAVLVGTAIGACLKRGIPENYHNTITLGLAVSVMIIGLQMALKTQNMIIIILSLIIGGVIGEAIKIDDKLNSFGVWVTKLVGASDDSKIGQAFITASLVFCVGAMSIVGSLQEGLTGDASTILAKSMLDGIASIIFTATLGVGVALSSITILVYQGGITMMAGVISPYLSEAVIREMTAVGGIIIMGIGASLLEYKRVKLANCLPALPLVILLTIIWQ